MANLTNNHTGSPFTPSSIQDAINQIKLDIENAIRIGGTSAKNALIRTQKPIKLIHNAVISELLNKRVHESLINPDPARLLRVAYPSARRSLKPIRLKDKELNLSGFFMKKYQDISVVPNNILVKRTQLKSPTMIEGEEDIFGKKFTESVLSINIRSQLSSTNKNKGTLYERTIAEALNFHKRLPKMVLTEVYLIAAKEYDEDAAKTNTVGFKHADNLEKYIKAFQAINGRVSPKDEKYKYERCCLLIVDFDRVVPKIYNSTTALKQDGFLPARSSVTMTGLDYTSFVRDILRIYTARFPDNTFN